MELVLDPTNFWKPFFTVILCFVIAQGAKMILDVRAGRTTSPFENGGMPSSHAATVMGLLVVVLLEQGLSLLFLVVAVYAVITMNDAMGVRRETSRHSTFLNELTKQRKFRIVGHEPMEVLVGAIIGFVVPLLLYAFI